MNIKENIKWHYFKKWQKKIHNKPRWKGDDRKSDYGDRGIDELLAYMEDWCTTQGMFFMKYYSKERGHELWVLRNRIRKCKHFGDNLDEIYESKVREIVGDVNEMGIFVKSSDQPTMWTMVYKDYDEKKIQEYYDEHWRDILDFYIKNPKSSECCLGHRSAKDVAEEFSFHIKQPLFEPYTWKFKSWLEDCYDRFDGIIGSQDFSYDEVLDYIFLRPNVAYISYTDVLRYVFHKTRMEKYEKECELRIKAFTDIFTYFTEYSEEIKTCRALGWED